jgi:hypothetical protein
MDKMIIDEVITGVVVCCNSIELLKRAYESVRKHHLDMQIIIVDGSEQTNPCFKYVGSLENENTKILQVGYNIGHGRGMCLGLYHVETPYVLFFDSDIEMLKSPLKKMLALFEEDTFGVGYFEKTGFDGFNYGAKLNHAKEDWMPYLHPYFQLVNVANYKKYYPYVHHGAPCYLTMFNIYKRGLSNKVLKEFPGLGHTSGKGFTWSAVFSEYVRHDTMGTRKINKINGNREIEGSWELNGGQV